MRVMVTGGTGFVGAHSVRSLVDAGHDVQLLVRSPSRIGEILQPLGVGATHFVVGDMCDADAVGRAMAGCDAVLHGSAVVSLDRRRATEVLEANPRGTEVVIGAAVERGLDPIVYVSSMSALFAPGVPLVHAELPPARAESPYARSKAEAEQCVRRHQDDGAPITITYPSAVVGPPAGTAFGEVAAAIVTHLEMGVLPLRHGAWSIIDVRDVAAVHAAVMEPGRGPRRYTCGGHFMTMPRLGELYRELTGRRFPVLPIPGAAYRGFGRVMDAVMRVTSVESVFTHEAMAMLTQWVPTDDRPMAEDLGIMLRDPKETLADAICALFAAGRLSAKHLGRLAEGGRTETGVG